MTLRLISAGVAVAGLAIATYLTIVHYAGGEPACFIAHGCAVVQQSSYAELAGVPVALLGAGAYVIILAGLVRDGDTARMVAAAVALTGTGFSAWLTYVEIARLESICAWCVASAVCMTTLGVACVRRVAGGASAPEAPRRRH